MRAALGADGSAVLLDNLAAGGQADARALMLRPAVQPLEQHEDPLRVLRIEAQPIVLHAELVQPAAVSEAGVVFRTPTEAEPTAFLPLHSKGNARKGSGPDRTRGPATA